MSSYSRRNTREKKINLNQTPSSILFLHICPTKLAASDLASPPAAAAAAAAAVFTMASAGIAHFVVICTVPPCRVQQWLRFYVCVLGGKARAC